MKQRKLGKSGLSVSEVGLGCWQLGGVLSGKMKQNQQFAETDHRNYNRHGAAFSQGETFSGVPFEQPLNLLTRSKPGHPWI